MAKSILLIDDDPAILYLHSRHFQGQGWTVYRALGGEDGLKLYASHSPDVVLLDINMPDISGFEVLERLAAVGATVILLTGHGEVENAVRAMKLGAENFITKPASISHLDALVSKAGEKAILRRSNRLLAEQLRGNERMGLGRSPKMQALARQVERLSSTEDPVLIRGESGTGKGYLAQLIHWGSARAGRPFLRIDCAGLSASVLDIELFGQEKGAFTDSSNLTKGLLEIADGGTLFLDEVGDLAPELQPKLLKLLETKTYRRLGGGVELRSSARLIAATERDMEAEMAAGRFREDLFHRLSLVCLELPPVRERATEDVLDLIQRVHAELRERHPRAPARLSDAALGVLVAFDWPGNIRQMRTALEHALVMSSGAAEVLSGHLPDDLHQSEPAAHRGRDTFPGMTLKELERRHIERTLIAYNGHRTQAAEALGIARATLHNKIREYALEDVGRGDISMQP